ncbi:MAG: hypothetical protein IJR88_02560 [Clostridia bacterium]|nr:hypothetical protein [Clostridia bacterium]
MYTRSYDSSERQFRLPPRYGGSAFSPQKEQAALPQQSPPTSLPVGLQSLAGLFGHPPVAGTPEFDELLLMGLIFLLLGSEGGKDLIPILALLLFCNP